MSRSFKLISGVLILALLAVIAGLSVYLVTRQPAATVLAPGERAPIAVTITDKTCDPNALEVESGRTTFTIRNTSSRAVEWEILNGVMVLEERENIAPGFTSNLTANLEPGDYQITCGLLTNPRGRLTVVAAAGYDAKRKPSTVDLLGPLSEYTVFVYGQTDALVKKVSALTQAVRAGNLAPDQARALYVAAREPYLRIQPMTLMFGDLDAAIDGRAAYLEKREADPAFSGFHRIEYELFERHATDGLAPVADKLDADIKALAAKLMATVPPAEIVIAGAAKMIDRAASGKLSGDENPYAHTDLSDIAANVEGARKIVRVFKPLAEKSDPQLAAAIEDQFLAVEKTLATHRAEGGTAYVAFDTLGEADRATLKDQLSKLAGSLALLGSALGLS